VVLLAAGGAEFAAGDLSPRDFRRSAGGLPGGVVD